MVHRLLTSAIGVAEIPMDTPVIAEAEVLLSPVVEATLPSGWLASAALLGPAPVENESWIDRLDEPIVENESRIHHLDEPVHQIWLRPYHLTMNGRHHNLLALPCPVEAHGRLPPIHDHVRALTRVSQALYRSNRRQLGFAEAAVEVEGDVYVVPVVGEQESLNGHVVLQSRAVLSDSDNIDVD